MLRAEFTEDHVAVFRLSYAVQGTLANLDTQNPVLYIDFPTGRLKCFGTLIFPKNKYMLLRLGQKDVMCEEVLESMVRAIDFLQSRRCIGLKYII